MRQCTICSSPNRVEIDSAILERVPDREIVRRYPDLVRSSIARHRLNHVSHAGPDVEPAAVVPKQTSGPWTPPGKSQSAIEHQEMVVVVTWTVIQRALKKGNLAIVTQNLKNQTEAVKSLAGLRGEIEPPPPSTQLNFQVVLDTVLRRRDSTRTGVVINVSPDETERGLANVQ